jgi:hypothetical protein
VKHSIEMSRLISEALAQSAPARESEEGAEEPQKEEADPEDTADGSAEPGSSPA